MAREPKRSLLAAVALCAVLAGCAGSDETAAGDRRATTSSTSSSATSAVPSSKAPDPDEPEATSTTLDAELACLSDALAAHPELLTYLDGSADPAEATSIDALRALLVARTCLPADVMNELLAEALGAELEQPLTDFQLQCLTDLLLSLPDEDLAALLDASPDAEDPTVGSAGADIAARLLRLCGIERS